jgi:hypothetical protein
MIYAVPILDETSCLRTNHLRLLTNHLRCFEGRAVLLSDAAVPDRMGKGLNTSNNVCWLSSHYIYVESKLG